MLAFMEFTVTWEREIKQDACKKDYKIGERLKENSVQNVLLIHC